MSNGVNLLRPMRKAWALVGVVLLVGCGVGPQVDPFADHVIDLRAEEADRINLALAESVDALEGDVLAEARVDECYEGHRGWKRTDPYRHRCSLHMSVLIGIDGDFQTQMLQFDDSLRGLGWRSDSDDEWPGMKVAEYWDLREREAGGGDVRISRLPGVWGIRRDGLRMLFDYSHPDDELGRYSIDLRQGVTHWGGITYHRQQELFDVDEVADQAVHQHLIMLTVTGHYLEQ